MHQIIVDYSRILVFPTINFGICNFNQILIFRLKLLYILLNYYTLTVSSSQAPLFILIAPHCKQT